MTKDQKLLSGIIGWPVSHSLSPRLHNYWLREYEINGEYILLPTKPENLEQELHTLYARGFRGANITIPHKESALKYIDEIDPLAARVGAANTIIVRKDGKLKGLNTDVYGFQENIKEAPKGTALVLGAGGASRAVIVALQESNFKKILLTNRTKDRAKKTAKELGGDITIIDWETKESFLKETDLLINTTSLGMINQPTLEINLTTLPEKSWVTDIVYTPLETPLLKQATASGHKTIDGLGMLLHQACPAFYAWYNHFPEITQTLKTQLLSNK